MKPQTAAYLANAIEAVADARRILAIDIPRQAGRLAYYAEFHAAQALIFERTAKGRKNSQRRGSSISQPRQNRGSA